jgi:hypothetical protein
MRRGRRGRDSHLGKWEMANLTSPGLHILPLLLILPVYATDSWTKKGKVHFLYKQLEWGREMAANGRR